MKKAVQSPHRTRRGILWALLLAAFCRAGACAGRSAIKYCTTWHDQLAIRAIAKRIGSRLLGLMQGQWPARWRGGNAHDRGFLLAQIFPRDGEEHVSLSNTR